MNLGFLESDTSYNQAYKAPVIIRIFIPDELIV